MAPEEPPSVEAAYDRLARSYGSRGDDPYRADLEFPATTRLVPDVAGERVLDAGCGHGRYAEWLLERGATVVAVDSSAEMVEHARERLGDRATVHRATLGESLEFADDGAFDGIVSGLALHYVEDWEPVFAEFARVLRPDGFLVFSTHNPVDDYVAFDAENYFEVECEQMTWSAAGEPVEVPFYRRPFSEVITPLIEAGFRLEEVVEPTPTEAFAERRPESYQKRSTYPTFLCIRASAE